MKRTRLGHWAGRTLGALWGVALSLSSVHAAELPVPCVAGSCGPNAPATWVTSGAASAVQTGTQLSITQTTSSATLNWQSFNISSDAKVAFSQPDASAIALNRIFQADPSRIFGSLEANGRIYLLNQNGILFGEGSRVEVGGLVASSLNLTQSAIELGIAGAASRGDAAFAPYTDAAGNELESGGVTIERTATLTSSGGEVFVFAPQIENRGTIRTPDGQTLLAAGQRVFLTTGDATVRGLLVEVSLGGTVTNGDAANATRSSEQQLGQIVADRGNVTLAGLAVNQLGRVSATTSVRAGGSVRLIARDVENPAAGLVPSRAGAVTLGERSATSVLLDDSDEATVDVNAQPRSSIEVRGRSILMESDARIVAPGGAVTLFASSVPTQAEDGLLSVLDDSRLVIERGATIDVSGETIELPVERNVVRAELRGSQLADSPAQREGALRSEPVFVDVRRTGTREDGSTWVGSPIGDLAGDASNVRRDVRERNLAGGAVSLVAQGGFVVQRGATVDVSGGAIEWQAGYVRTTQVLGENGVVYDIADATADRRYVAIVDRTTITDQRWGTTSTFHQPGFDPRGRFEDGYLEGKDAGTLRLLAPTGAFDGDLAAALTVGPRQRAAPTDFTGLLYRPFDQVPVGGQLIVGFDGPQRTNVALFVTQGIDLRTGFALDRAPADWNALTDPWPTALATVQLRPELFGRDAATRVALYADDTVTLAADAPLDLPGASELVATAGALRVESDVTTPSGRIEFAAVRTVARSGADPTRTPSVTVTSGTTLSTAGVWVNEARGVAGATNPVPYFIDGGSVAVTASGGDATLEPGTRIDVSSGARRTPDGGLIGGRAGSVTLAATTNDPTVPVELTIGAEVNGFGGARGGSLSLAAGSVCIAASSCTIAEGRLVLAPEWLRQGGFEDIALNARLSGLTLGAGEVLDLRAQEYEVITSALGRPSGADAGDVFRVVTRPDSVRRPMRLTLGATNSSPQGVTFSDLVIARGAEIRMDPQSEVTLRTDSRLFIEGAILVASGAVSATLENSLGGGGRATEQAIWLSPGAVIDVSGITRFRDSALGLAEGDVLPGGSVSLIARRGSVHLLPGSRIDVSGTFARLDLPSASGTFVRQEVPSAAGSLSVRAAEAAIVSGALRAMPGASSAAGGSFTLGLDGTDRRDQSNVAPIGDRRITVTAGASPTVVAPGTVLPGVLYGVGRVSDDTLMSAGFDDVSLFARNLYRSDLETGETRVVGFGAVSVEPGVLLTPRARLRLDAPEIAMDREGSALLSASHVALGLTLNQNLDNPLPSSGGGALTLRGGLIDVVGFSTTRGIGDLTLDSAGDIRFTGILPFESREISGAFRSGGSLNLRAQAVYPTTLTRFDLSVDPASTGQLTIARAPGAQEAPTILSAGGALRLTAPRIEQGGYLAVPVGTLTLESPEIVLAAGGVTSSATGGATIPFGSLQGGTAWAFELDERRTIVYGTGGVPLPEGRVELIGDSIDFQTGATLDVSGGGDLLAYEFVAGPTGTQDVLSARVRPDQFAIVPGLGLDFAPFDPAESRDSPLRAGDSIFLNGVAGLPTGTYALLPARYALLPGAFLVTPEAGYQDLPAGESVVNLDGSVVTSGFRTIAGTEIRDGRASGFRVAPASIARSEARYDTRLANEFFLQQFADTGIPGSRLPRDAGTIVATASTALRLDGSLDVTTPMGARGAAFEVASQRIAVLGPGGTADPGFVAVTAEALNRLGAQSLLLGARRSPGASVAGADLLVTVADEVRVGSGARLSAGEVLLSSNVETRVEEGSEITAVSSAGLPARDLELAGGASVLRVASSGQVDVTRTGTTDTGGRLLVDDGSTLRTAGALLIDVIGPASIAADLAVTRGALAVGAPRIVLSPDGATGTAGDGVLLDASQLSGLSLAALRLRAREQLGIAAGVSLGATEVSFEAPVIRALSPVGASEIRAGTLLLSGAAAESSVPPVTGSAELRWASERTRFEGGVLRFDAFSDVRLAASESILASGSGTARSSGSFTLETPFIAGAAGVDFDWRAEGALRANRPTGDALALPDLGGLGARLGFSGADVSIDATLRAVAGALDVFAARGDVLVSEGALLDATGAVESFAGRDIAAPAGTVRIEAAAGNIRIAEGARINVSAPAQAGSGGRVELLAAAGSIVVEGEALGASDSAIGGRLRADARAFDFAALSDVARAGGFTGGWDFVLRGPGDLDVAVGSLIETAELHLAAEQGRVTVRGAIDAQADEGGRVVLAARDGVSVSGRIDARATAPEQRGGRIDLQSLGAITIASSGQLDVSGTGSHDPALAVGGRIVLRLPRSQAESVLDAVPGNDGLVLAGALTGARDITVEGFQRFTVADGRIDASDVLPTGANPWFAALGSFASNAPAIAERVGYADVPEFRVLPGLELVAPGALILEADWNLASWRFAGSPGVLTLRAGTDLQFARSLSDGFAADATGIGGFQLPATAGPAWSYRLIAGADAASPRALATRPGGTGSVSLAPGTPRPGPGGSADFRLVRTGQGDIDVAAATDFVLGNQASVLYTAGAAGPGIRFPGSLQAGGLANLPYPIDGGDISIVAGRDILGAPSAQLYTEWLWRTGREATAQRPRATGWTVAFDRFEQGVAALAGGSVSVRAGRHVLDFSASVPSIGRQVGGTAPADDRVEIVAGGPLRIEAGGDVRGGSFYVARGHGVLRADGAIAASFRPDANVSLAPVLALGESRMDVLSRESSSIETVLDPHLLAPSFQLGGTAGTFFSTYTGGSSLNVTAVGGNLRLFGATELGSPFEQAYPTSPGGIAGIDVARRVAPPTLRAAALSGDLRVGGPFSMWPAPRGNLDLLAGSSVVFESESASPFQIIMSDANLLSLPVPGRPRFSFTSFADPLGSAVLPSADFYAPSPIHGATPDDPGTDPVPVRIVARTGDVAMQPLGGAGAAGLMFLPKAVLISAGRDVVNVSLRVQNVAPTDVSTVEAGRDFTYLLSRDVNGRVVSSVRTLAVNGPGRLEILSGRSIDLQTSGGIVTEGNLRNPALADIGADISLTAGIADAMPAYAGFVDRYLVTGSDYDEELIAYAEAQAGLSGLDKADALGVLQALPLARQRDLIEQVFFNELRESGRAAARQGPDNADFTRGFDALEALFPGSNPDVDAGETNPYSGDLRLQFSRIYTLDGGTIRSLVPGGEVNVGLATPPAAFGIQKAPSELGIVAQSLGSVESFSFRDFQVNESRVFAADGGNILVWSTRGDIDAGRGAKTAISAPPPVVTIDEQGQTRVVFPAALSGSGIQTLATSPGREPGDVDLFAPRGVVNAGDAGIVAGNLTIAATAVIGAGNISVSGTSVGVPVDTGGLGASLAGASGVASSASSAATAGLGDNDGAASDSPLADKALGFLEVFVLGFGEEQCRSDDLECLKRQRSQ